MPDRCARAVVRGDPLRYTLRVEFIPHLNPEVHDWALLLLATWCLATWCSRRLAFGRELRDFKRESQVETVNVIDLKPGQPSLPDRPEREAA